MYDVKGMHDRPSSLWCAIHGAIEGMYDRPSINLHVLQTLLSVVVLLHLGHFWFQWSILKTLCDVTHL